MTRLTIISILTLFSLTTIFGQTKTKDIKSGGFELQSSTVDPKINAEYCSMGQIPKFPGGQDSLVAFAKHILYYPKSALRDSIQGKVGIQFTIDKNGKVIDEKIIKSVRTDLDTLCLAMVRRMPTWTAGQLDGKPIAIKFMWAINLQLSNL